MAGRHWWVVGDRSQMVCVVTHGHCHPLCPDGGQLSSLWAVGPVLGHGGQSSFVGGCSEHFSWLVGIGGLWVIVCR